MSSDIQLIVELSCVVFQVLKLNCLHEKYLELPVFRIFKVETAVKFQLKFTHNCAPSDSRAVWTPGVIFCWSSWKFKIYLIKCSYWCMLHTYFFQFLLLLIHVYTGVITWLCSTPDPAHRWWRVVNLKQVFSVTNLHVTKLFAMTFSILFAMTLPFCCYDLSICVQKFYLRCLKSQANTNFVCPKNTSCTITKETRSHCQYCRYNKCIQLGMYKPGNAGCHDNLRLLYFLSLVNTETIFCLVG